MSTRELLEALDREPCAARVQQDKRVRLLEKLELAKLTTMPSGDDGYILTADGRDLLHGASERRRSA